MVVVVALALAALFRFAAAPLPAEAAEQVVVAQAMTPATADIKPLAPIREELSGDWSGAYERTSTKWTNRASFTFTRVDPILRQAFGTLRFTVNGRCDTSICNRDIPFSAIQSRDGTQILVRSDDRTVWYTLWWDGSRLKGRSGDFTVDLEKVR